MEAFMKYLEEKTDACKAEIAALQAEGRMDDAAFAKVRANIYDICRTVTDVHVNRTKAGKPAVQAQLDRFEAGWSEALAQAKIHGDAKAAAVEEIKLQTLREINVRFAEAAQ